MYSLTSASSLTDELKLLLSSSVASDFVFVVELWPILIQMRYPFAIAVESGTYFVQVLML